MSMCRATVAAALLLLAAATAAVAAPENGAKFKDWTAQCEPIGESQQVRCYISQSLVTKDEGKPLMGIAIGYVVENDQPAMLVRLPLGVFLRPGIALQIDGGEQKNYPYERCDPSGCVAGVPMTEALVAAFKAGNKAVITFHNGQKPIPLPVSLNGFTAGFDSLR